MLPLVPFCAALGLLEFVHGDAETAPPLALPVGRSGDGAEVAFFNGLIVYLSVGIFHVAACLAAIAYLLARVLALPRGVQGRVWLVIAALLVLLAVANGYARAQAVPGALNLTYRYVCEVVWHAQVMPHLLPESCFSGPLSPFALLAVFPYSFGLLAAVCAGGLACTAALPLPQGDPEAAQRRVVRVERAFQITTVVLVTSTISMMLFYRLPIAVLPEAGPQALVLGYGQGLAMFWGAVFTLTLLATFGPALAFLQRPVDPAPGGVAPEPGARAMQSFRQYVSSALAVLAPLVVGALGPVLELLAGAL